jgi:beta-phosphoglucomutase-like phosphatase (HAD superfamily)
MLKVTVDPEAAVVISDAVPEILTLLATGVAVPVSPVSVLSAPLALSNSVQVGVVTPADDAILVRI